MVRKYLRLYLRESLSILPIVLGSNKVSHCLAPGKQWVCRDVEGLEFQQRTKEWISRGAYGATKTAHSSIPPSNQSMLEIDFNTACDIL